MNEIDKKVIREALDLIREALESYPVDLDTIEEQAQLILTYEKEAPHA